jgi:hypothetical protein
MTGADPARGLLVGGAGWRLRPGVRSLALGLLAATGVAAVTLLLPTQRSLANAGVLIAHVVPFVLAVESVAAAVPEWFQRGRTREVGAVLLFAAFLCYLVPKLFAGALSGDFDVFYSWMRTTVPYVILAIVVALRLGGASAQTVRRVGYACLLVMLSGLEDLMFLVVNRQPIPAHWTWADHMTVFLGHPASRAEAFGFIGVHLLAAAAVLTAPWRGRAIARHRRPRRRRSRRTPSEPTERLAGRLAGRLGHSPRAVLALLAGRGVFRSAQWLSGMALLSLWGADAFGPYATALGSTGWLLAVTASGTEKIALTLGAVTGGEHVARLALRWASLLVCAGVLALAGTTVLAAESSLWWYAAGATYATGLGCTVVVTALFRVWQRPVADAVAFGVLAAAHVVTVGGAVLGWGPRAVLGLLAGSVVSVAAALLIAARRWLAHPAGPARAASDVRVPQPTRQVAVAAALMGSTETLGMAGVAVLYQLLAATARPGDTSVLYALMLASQAVSGLVLYLLRLAQPGIARNLSESTAVGAAHGSRLANRALLVGAAVTAAAIAFAHLPVLASGVALTAVLVVLLTTEIVVFAMVFTAVCLLESSGSAGRRRTALAAVFAFAVVAGSGMLLVPTLGVVGCLVALLLGLCAQAAALRTRRARNARQDVHAQASAQSLVADRV